MAAACGGGPSGPSLAEVLRLPPGFPLPAVPPDNPLTADKIELGRHLFYDTRLSMDGTMSCASCHEQARAFTDGKARAVGVTGEVHPRGAMALTNVGYYSVLTWGNPLITTLEQQALLPMFGTTPIELGLAGREDKLLRDLRAETRYAPMFRAAFPGERDPFTLANVTRAIASFERALISGRSAYDRWAFGGESEAMSRAAKRGLELFNSERAECYHCHAGFNFSDSTRTAETRFVEAFFHNTGLYNLDAAGTYPEGGRGAYETSGRASDMGRFRAPSLRNIEVTAPYMHDGSIATLEEVLEHYAAGGRTIHEGPYAGVGRTNPNKSDLVRPLDLSADEKRDIIELLKSLTDPTFLSDPRLSNPWR
jgi:cytochrome c peroxidase